MMASQLPPTTAALLALIDGERAGPVPQAPVEADLIAELTARIERLEAENNHLRGQVARDILKIAQDDTGPALDVPDPSSPAETEDKQGRRYRRWIATRVLNALIVVLGGLTGLSDLARGIT
jgi:hypothetical protein